VKLVRLHGSQASREIMAASLRQDRNPARGGPGAGVRPTAMRWGTHPSRQLAAHPPPWGEFVQMHDDREAVQVSPDELPAIDIHSL